MRSLTMFFCLLAFFAVSVPEAHAGSDANAYFQEAKALYTELLQFKDSPRFKEYGFGSGGPYNGWITRFKALNQDPARKVLFQEYGIVVGEFYNLAQDYMNNGGRDNDYTKSIRREVDPKFGLK